MDRYQLNWIANSIWGIADDLLYDIYVGILADISELERVPDRLLGEIVRCVEV